MSRGSRLAPKARMPFFARVALFWVFAADTPRLLGLGSYLTLLTGVAAGLAVGITELTPRVRQRRGYETTNPDWRRPPGVLWVFVVIAGLGLARGPSLEGLQNVLVYVAFACTMPLVAAYTTPGTPRKVLRWVTGGALVASVLYLPAPFIDHSRYGATGVYSARPLSMIALLGICATVPLATRNRETLLLPAFFTVVIALSLSRTSLVVAALLLVFAAAKDRSPRQILRLLAGVAIGVAVAVAAFTYYAPLHNRFTVNDRATVAGFQVGTSGRAGLWGLVTSHLGNSAAVAFGHGAGSVERLIISYYGAAVETQPHNDYLRVLYDYGLLGLVFFMLAMSALLIGALKRWRHGATADDRAVHLAAALGMVVILGEGLTANSVIYIFVMSPVAMLLGVSLGRAETPTRGPSGRGSSRRIPTRRATPARKVLAAAGR